MFLCRLPHMPHILRITTRQLFVALDPCGREIRFCLCIRSSCKGGKKVLEQEISSFESSLSLSFPSSSQTATASPSSGTVQAVWHWLVAPAGIPLCLCAGWLPGWGPVPGVLAPGWAHRTGSGAAHRAELQAVKVWR